MVETAVKDPFDHWLSADTKMANVLLDYILERVEDRKRKKKNQEVARASATKRLRLPGKLADCSHIFINLLKDKLVAPSFGNYEQNYYI